MTDTWLKDHLAAIGKSLEIAPLYPPSPARYVRHAPAECWMDITGIQKLLGHEMISTTMIYAKVQDATVEVAIARHSVASNASKPPLSDRPIAVDD